MLASVVVSSGSISEGEKITSKMSNQSSVTASLSDLYDKVSDQPFIWVREIDESERDQMMLKKVKWTYFDAYLWQTMWNHAKKSMEVSKLSDFVFFWRFQHSPIVKTLNLNVWTLPLIFLHDFTLFVIDMHQNRSVSLFSTPFDHFHFHALAALKW